MLEVEAVTVRQGSLVGGSQAVVNSVIKNT